MLINYKGSINLVVPNYLEGGDFVTSLTIFPTKDSKKRGVLVFCLPEEVKPVRFPRLVLALPGEAWQRGQLVKVKEDYGMVTLESYYRLTYLSFVDYKFKTVYRAAKKKFVILHG